MIRLSNLFRKIADTLTNPAMLTSTGIAAGVDLIIAANVRSGRFGMLDLIFTTAVVSASGLLNLEPVDDAPPRGGKLIPVEKRPERFERLEHLHATAFLT